MRNFHTALFTICLLTVSSACTPAENTSPSIEQLNQQYAGHSVDSFFLSYGRPKGKPVATAEGKIYHWVSIEPLADLPASGGFRGTPSIVQAEPTGTTELYCELNIHTDSKNIIQRFNILSDSQGKYTTSYCADIFSSPVTHKNL